MTREREKVGHAGRRNHFIVSLQSWEGNKKHGTWPELYALLLTRFGRKNIVIAAIGVFVGVRLAIGTRAALQITDSAWLARISLQPKHPWQVSS